MQIEKLRPSFSLDEERVKQLKQIAPEAFTDNQISFEVLREALGGYLEDDDLDIEHFGLFWPGKREARRMASIPSKGTLVPCPGEGIDEENTRNIFIEGENLEVLKILQKSYAGRIKMIYIDPPYNTGNDFVYDDDFTEPLEEYLRRTGQIDEVGKPLTTNKKSDGRFHSRWLSMMYPRLRLARNLLTTDGVIFVSIDDNEIHNLINIMTEIFGQENFLGVIVRATGTTTGQDAKTFGKSFDFLVAFSKSEDFNLVGIQLSEKDQKRFNKEDKKGKYSILQLRKTGNADRKEDRPNMYYHVLDPKGNKIYPIGPTGYLSRWRVGKDTYEKLLKDDMIEWIEQERNNKQVFIPYVKYYLEGRTKQPSPLWNDIDGNKKGTIELKDALGEKVFDNPKPTQLIKRIIDLSLSLENEEIFLDFFAGSGSSAEAVMNYNKERGSKVRYILVQYPELISDNKEATKKGFKTISDICLKRIKSSSKKIKGLDIDKGLKVFKLMQSSFKHWNNLKEENLRKLESLFGSYETSLQSDWQEENLLIEIVLLEGFPLDSQIEEIEDIKKNKILQITSDFCEHMLLVCFDKKVNSDTINNLQLGDKDIFICLDNAITDEEKVTLSDKGLIKTI